ncbi:hypothetical protein FACS1894191_6670 [Clostridia bacterium]|nr:hypothetical protein FACS1894191_6670 [Clostridia bacterium]
MGVITIAYIPFTDEQKQRANSVDLVDFLRSQGEEVTHSGHDFRWTRHDSVTLRGNRWFQHSESKGGLAIDFVRKFYSAGFPEAVTMLLNGEHGAGFAQAERKMPPKKEFVLPEAHSDMRRVFAYLIKERCIDRDIIRHFAKAGLLFEDKKYHNAVFVGKDENDVAKHAHKRSTLTVGRNPSGGEKSYRGNVEGSDAKCSFHHIGTSEKLYIFEAPIDMLSFLTMYPKDWREHSYVALGGVSGQAMLWTLEQNPQLQEISLCLDNDAAGIAAAERLTQALQEAGYESVSCLLPNCKDWNEQLQHQCLDEPEMEMSM